jgi:hypothetical protein
MNILFEEPVGIGAGVQRMIEQFYDLNPGPITVGIRSESHPSMVFRIDGNTAAEVIAKAQQVEAVLKATPQSNPDPAAYAVKMSGRAHSFAGMTKLMDNGKFTEAGNAMLSRWNRS